LYGKQLKIGCRLNGIIPSIGVVPGRIMKGHEPTAHRFNLALPFRFPLLL